mgnify:CR=1 FL=1
MRVDNTRLRKENFELKGKVMKIKEELFDCKKGIREGGKSKKPNSNGNGSEAQPGSENAASFTQNARSAEMEGLAQLQMAM